MRSLTINVPHPITVHEHRAPTDDSIRMLREMEEETLRNILSAVVIQDNLLFASAFHITHNHFKNQVSLHIRFTINGIEHHVVETLDKFEMTDSIARSLRDSRYEEVVNTIRKHMVEAISKHLFRDLDRTVIRELFLSK